MAASRVASVVEEYLGCVSRLRVTHSAVAISISAALVAVVTGVIALFEEWVPVLSLGVLYVFAVLPVAVVWGLRLALPVSVASMLAFNWLFLPPRHTHTHSDGENWFALAVYLATAVVVSWPRRSRTSRTAPLKCSGSLRPRSSSGLAAGSKRAVSSTRWKPPAAR